LKKKLISGFKHFYYRICLMSRRQPRVGHRHVAVQKGIEEAGSQF
jgi:hypothetical protein